MTAKLTTEKFKEKAIAKHGDRYDYSLVEYVNNKTKVKIICRIHWIFWQTPDNHHRGQGCPECGRVKFVRKKDALHTNKKCYSLTCYTPVCFGVIPVRRDLDRGSFNGYVQVSKGSRLG